MFCYSSEQANRAQTHAEDERKGAISQQVANTSQQEYICVHSQYAQRFTIMRNSLMLQHEFPFVLLVPVNVGAPTQVYNFDSYLLHNNFSGKSEDNVDKGKNRKFMDLI